MSELKILGEQIQTHEVTKTLEGVMHVFQGNHDKLPELMRDAGSLLVRLGKKLTTTQIVLAVSVLAIGVIAVAVNMEERNHANASAA